jgi:hypothetical protein
MKTIIKKSLVSSLSLVLLSGIFFSVGFNDRSIFRGDATNTFATDLFISEYIEGSSNNKAIEIFNGTGASINLKDYSLVHYNNGASESSGTRYTYTYPDLILPHGASYTVYKSLATASFKPSLFSASSTSSVFGFNGDDAISLNKTISSVSTIIDVFGIIGMDPGNGWVESGTGITYGFKDSSVTGSTENRTLTRLKTVLSPVVYSLTYSTVVYEKSFNPAEWGVYAVDTNKFLGWHSFGSFESIGFSQNFLLATTGKTTVCNAEGLSWTILSADYNLIKSEEKTIVSTNPSNNITISDALSRYNYLRTIDPTLPNFIFS